ncbi:VOC family protein [Ancylobacter terrae]|uniref:VOC family protein n=1 Tax=Ancylobacter sp. sgz301288 TaxID=3342077 RepID=UPI00385ED698
MKNMEGAMADRIDYIEFPSLNRAASSAFFRAAFGWGTVSYGPDYDGLEGAGIDGGIDQAPERVAAPLAVVRTDDLDQAEWRVIAAGGVITRPQFDFPGGRRFHFREPGGNELAVWVAREEG